MDRKTEALKKAVRLAGSRAALARLAGVSRQAVYKWREIPPEHCLRLESELGGKLDRYEMRPDVFGSREAAA